jgi:hypothetical protein
MSLSIPTWSIALPTAVVSLVMLAGMRLAGQRETGADAPLRPGLAFAHRQCAATYAKSNDGSQRTSFTKTCEMIP